MTTVAYRDRVLAMDTQATRGNGIRRCTKGHVLKDGSLFAGSGSQWIVKLVEEWCASGRHTGEEPDLTGAGDDDSLLALHVRDDGVWEIDHSLVPLLVEDQFTAVGSGADYAIGAMDRGASAYEAVETAAKYDAYTSAPIKTLEFTGQIKVKKRGKGKAK